MPPIASADSYYYSLVHTKVLGNPGGGILELLTFNNQISPPAVVNSGFFY